MNPGNSGGPLIDVESGKVVGINAAICAHMKGMSFAIPINWVRDIMADMSEGQERHHGYLGLGLATCTRPIGLDKTMPIAAVVDPRPSRQRSQKSTAPLCTGSFQKPHLKVEVYERTTLSCRLETKRSNRPRMLDH
jgi:S1-C subfamily serine protease